MKDQRAVPAKLQPFWDALESDVKLVHLHWCLFCQLYAASPDRVELLNESAALFFSMVQQALLHEVELGLTKLADPATTFGHGNLTLDALLEEVRSLKQESLCEALTALLNDYRSKCGKIVVVRNKFLAHSDLKACLKSIPLPEVSRQEIEDALLSLRAFMNEIEGHFTDCECAYDQLSVSEDGEALLEVLKRGLRYKELVSEGRISRMDLRNSRFWRVK